MFGVVDFGLMFEERVSLTNAARAGARFGSLNARAWSNAATPPTNTIQGQLLAAGNTTFLPNLSTNIVITYWIPAAGGLETQCGYYDYATGGFKNAVGTTYIDTTCILPGNFIRIHLKHNKSLITPILGQFFGSGVNIATIAEMPIMKCPWPTTSGNC
jgi:hypothetical protein